MNNKHDITTCIHSLTNEAEKSFARLEYYIMKIIFN